MNVKGDLRLEIDEQGIEARITITPDENGAELSPQSVGAILAEKRVREGIDTDAIEKAFRALQRKKGEPFSFIAARGTPPVQPEPESVQFTPLPIPPRLAATAQAVLGKSPPVHAYTTREERIKKERKVLKKPSLPFLPAKEEIEIVIEKHLVKEDVPIDATVRSTGFAAAGTLIATVTPGKPGKEGRSILGRAVPSVRSRTDGIFFCDGTTRSGGEVKAAVTGFLRRGDNWCDIVPFDDHVVEVSASPDGSTCLLSFTPGNPAAPAPDPAEVLARANTLGFAEQDLLPARELAALLAKACAKRTAVSHVPITPPLDGKVEVTVSPDRLHAVLNARKARGGGKPLAPSAIGEAIKASGVKGYNAETAKKDILAFLGGKEGRLADYPLASGRPGRPGRDGSLEWIVAFLPPADAQAIRATAKSGASKLSGLSSLAAFPLDRVESVARVEAGAEIVRIVPAVHGEPGTDVFGTPLPGAKGMEPKVRLFEGLSLQKGLVTAVQKGILEKAEEGATVLLRVRPHRDADLHVTVSEDRMSAELSFFPAEGAGRDLDPTTTRMRIAESGVARGLDEKKIAEAIDRMTRGQAFTGLVFAEGKRPPEKFPARVVYHAHMATGKSVTMRWDGRADFKIRDNITRIAKGDPIATVKPFEATSTDGWDVTGKVVAGPVSDEIVPQAGRGVRSSTEPDGSVLLVADADGELVLDGAMLLVRDVHQVDGDVSMASGNINFPGTVRISGSVRSGFTVSADGDIVVGGFVEAAVVSAGGSIEVAQGIKGEGKAILRAKKGIVALFAEQATLLAGGDITLGGACIQCHVTCGGKLSLETEKGSLIGGSARARHGMSVHNLGSPGGAHTDVSFGQDYMVKDRIAHEEKELSVLRGKVGQLEAKAAELEKEIAVESARSHPPSMARAMKEAEARREAELAKARATIAQALKMLEDRKRELGRLYEGFHKHAPSEIEVRGSLHPGSVVESHTSRFETRVDKNLITLRFDAAQGKIVEKL